MTGVIGLAASLYVVKSTGFLDAHKKKKAKKKTRGRKAAKAHFTIQY